MMHRLLKWSLLLVAMIILMVVLLPQPAPVHQPCRLHHPSPAGAGGAAAPYPAAE